MSPKVSICIPAFREAAKLAKLLDSISAQDFCDFEVIVSDDSPDEAIKIVCEAYPKLNIHYFRNIPSKGSPANWNYAISKATAPWVKLMHHDDFFYDASSLSNFMIAAETQPEIDHFFCDSFILNSNSNQGYVYSVDQKLLKRIAEQPAYLFHKNVIGSPSVGFFRRNLMIQFDEKLIWLVDVEFYCRLLNTCKVAHISKPLVTTLISDSQLTKSLQNELKYEIGEFIYSYNKLKCSFNYFNRKMMHMRMLDLCIQFNVRSSEEIRESQVFEELPFLFRCIIIGIKIHPRLATSLFYRIFKFQTLR